LIPLGFLLFCWPPGGDFSAGQQTKEQKPTAIPLDSMYATMWQKPMHHVVAAYKLYPDGKKVPSYPYSFHLNEIRQWPLGASNVCLVCGKDITEAIQSTLVALACGADTSVYHDPNSKCKKLWIVANLGVASSVPTKWVVNSVTIHKQTIRVNYTEPEESGRMPSTCDLRQYLLWAPLGELPAGTYTLELYDAEQRRVTVLRSVRHFGF